MKLKLKRPLVIFDVETTGLNITQDRIIEIGYIKVMPNGNEESKTIRINPGRHIPENSTKIHGITDEDVADCPTFMQIARSLADTFKGCDFAGFNSNHFDIPILVEEMYRAGVPFDVNEARLIDVQNIFHKMEQRTLAAAYKFYCKKEHTDAHAALGDTEATYEVLQAQLDMYADTLQNDVGFLSDFSKIGNNVDLTGRLGRNEEGEIVFNFGKYKGKAVKQVFQQDPGYYGWIQQGDFSQETKNILTRMRLAEMETMRHKNRQDKAAGHTSKTNKP